MASDGGAAGHWSGGVATDSGKASPDRGKTDLKPTAELSEEATLRKNVGSWKWGEAGAPAAPLSIAGDPGAPEDVAEAVAYVLGAPAHVQVHDILLRPTEQPN